MLFRHIRDIILLPFTVTCIVPWFIYNEKQSWLTDTAIVKVFGIVFLLIGLSLFAYTVFLFNKIGKGTLAPWSPKQKLVITGPYQYCRNPMITGVLSILIGEALFLHSKEILIWALLFFCINSFYFMVAEEPGLEERFGDDYRHYKQHVPRWIPNLRPYKKVIEN